MDQSFSKNFSFNLIHEWAGYISSLDPTKVAENIMVEGSYNIYKKISGNLSVREGMKLKGPIDSTNSPISSEFVWNTSWGNIYPLIVSNSKLSFDFNDVRFDLMTGLTKTRFVFDTWNNFTSAKDELLFVQGDNNIYSWTGGVAKIASAGTGTDLIVPDANGGLSGTIPINALNFNGVYTPISGKVVYLGGSGYKAGDTISIGGAGTGATAEVLTTSDLVALTIGVTAGNAGSGYAVGDILYVAPNVNLTGSLGLVCKVATISGGDATGPVSSVTLLYGGYQGYSSTSGLPTINGAAVTGKIVNISLYNTGINYKVGDIVTVDGGVGGTIKVLSILGGGKSGGISTFSLNSQGSDYSTGITTLSGGSGSGGQVNITSLGSSGTGCQIDVLTTGNGSILNLLLLTLGNNYTVSTNTPTAAITGIGTGAVVNIASVYTGSVLTIDGYPNWQKAGFEGNVVAEKKLIINGTEYTYNGGEDTTTLLNVSPTVTGVSPGDYAIQGVITHKNTPITTLNPGLPNLSDYFTFYNDFIKVIRNQLYVGSYQSRFLFISASDDFTNFTEPVVRVSGDPQLIQFGGTLNGIGVRDGAAVISYGTSNWEKVEFKDVTLGTGATSKNSTGTGIYNTPVFTIYPTANECGAYSHEFISSSGNNIVYFSKDKQVRTLGDFNQLFVQGYPSLSLDINTELSQENFSGGGLICIGEFTYLTAPDSGKVYVYQVRQSVNENGVSRAERLWHAPMLWNATRIDSISGTVYAYSNANPQYYQVWDTNQWHDDSTSGPLPYNCVLALGYRNIGQFKGGSRALLQSFDKNYTEGYIASGTDLTLVINYEYEGSYNILTAPVNSVSRPAKLFGGSTGTTSSPGSLGDESFGDSPIGDGISDAFVDNLSKFRSINFFNLINCFEYQPILESDALDARWELLAMGTNAKAGDTEPTNIINK